MAAEDTAGPPRAERAADSKTDSSTITRRGCLWLLAAARTGDHDVVATVVSLHPPWRCPAWRESAA